LERLGDPEMVSLRTELVELSKADAIVHALPERPSLIREAAAELGADAPNLLIIALERLGFDVLSEKIPPSAMNEKLLEIQRQAELHGQVAATEMANVVRQGQADPDMLRQLASIYAGSVERLLKQTFS
jgi:hypothetical protein